MSETVTCPHALREGELCPICHPHDAFLREYETLCRKYRAYMCNGENWPVVHAIHPQDTVTVDHVIRWSRDELVRLRRDSGSEE